MLRLEAERQLIEKTIQKYHGQYEFRNWDGITAEDLMTVLQNFKPNILHFSGHGTELDGIPVFLDKNDHGKIVPTQAFLDALTHYKTNLKLVVLNACYTSSLASKIVKNIDCVIGNPSEVSDEQATTFASFLYDCILDGDSVGDAFDKAKTNSKLSGCNHSSAATCSSRKGVSCHELHLFPSAKQDFENYLGSCVDFIQTKNLLDDTIFGDTYVANDAIFAPRLTWDRSDAELSEFEKEKWTATDFLNSNRRYVVISAHYGIGKTAFCRKLASDLALKVLEGTNDFIPMYVPLRFGLDKVDVRGNSLSSILSLLDDPKAKILFIYDGLDEYRNGTPEQIRELYQQINDNMGKYPNSKSIITTRPNMDYPRILNLEEDDKYVRLLPFTIQQVNEYFKKHKISLTYEEASKSGLESDEILKPLFAQMISLLFKEKKTVKMTEQLNLNRTLLFFEVVHKIVLGKHKVVAQQYDFGKFHFNEKQVLRRIAQLKEIYGNELTEKLTISSLKVSRVDIDQSIFDIFDKLISTYLYTIPGESSEVRFDFIHRSFVEYLLAEYYLECFLRNSPHKINLKLPNEVTIQFLDGLLDLINRSTNSSEYIEYLLKSFDIDISRVLKEDLINGAMTCFNDEKIYLNSEEEYPNRNDTQENLAIHRWISVLILNKLGNFIHLDNQKFFRLMRCTHAVTPAHLISINNIDLSRSEFDGDTPNYNLSGAHLNNSKFHGNFQGTIFSGADISYSDIDVGTSFMNSDFSGGILNNLRVDDQTVYSASFIHCNFTKCDLRYARISSSNLTGSTFSHADLRGTDLHSSNLSSTELDDILIDQDTSFKYVELFGDENQWRDFKRNKDRVTYLLSRMNPDLKEKILKDNPDLLSEEPE